jgi:hypothetical protein
MADIMTEHVLVLDYLSEVFLNIIVSNDTIWISS